MPCAAGMKRHSGRINEIALACTQARYNMGRSLWLTVAKNCHDSENGCKRFGGHRMWASDAAVGFVHGAKAKDKNDKGRYTLYGLKSLKCSDNFCRGLSRPVGCLNRTRTSATPVYRKTSVPQGTQDLSRSDSRRRQAAYKPKGANFLFIL